MPDSPLGKSTQFCDVDLEFFTFCLKYILQNFLLCGYVGNKFTPFLCIFGFISRFSILVDEYVYLYSTRIPRLQCVSISNRISIPLITLLFQIFFLNILLVFSMCSFKSACQVIKNPARIFYLDHIKFIFLNWEVDLFILLNLPI